MTDNVYIERGMTPLKTKENNIMTTTFKILDLCTGRNNEATLTKETKCFYTVSVANYYGEGRDGEFRFHKNTLVIDWQHLILIVETK